MRAQRGRYLWIGAAVAAAAAAAIAGAPERGQEPAAPPAAPAHASGPAPAPACGAEPDPANAAAVAAMVEKLRSLPPRRTPDGEEVVTLDNRGYGYAPPPGPFADLHAR